MPKLDRTGQTFGKLTVLQDSAESDQLLCRCACGREGNYPRTISKSTYRGRRMCAWCAGSPCVICGNIIPAKPGHPAATCSEACAADHIKRRGRDYYERVKDTDRWQATRASYLERLQHRIQNDPAFAEKIRSARVAALRRHAARVSASPEKRQAMLAKKRAWANARLDVIRKSGKYDQYLRRHQLWYASLSRDEYWRIFRAPVLQRELMSKRHALSRRLGALSHRIHGNKMYTRDEELYIVKHYDDKGPGWLAQQLGRSYHSIVVKAIALRLRE